MVVVVGGTEQHAVRAIRAPTLGLLAAAVACCCLPCLRLISAPPSWDGPRSIVWTPSFLPTHIFSSPRMPRDG